MKKKYVIYIFFLLILAIICALLIINKSYIFPPILYINLDSRKDRMQELTSEFASFPVAPERVSAVKYSPGWKGCSASHLKCITIAKERNYPWALIVEDDCALTTIALKQFTSVLPFLWNSKNNWDIFYGGTTHIKNAIKISYSPPIFQVDGYATHFCLIHKSTYDKILNNHPRHIDNFKKPIDVFYADNFRIWTTVPFIAKQRPSISDIQDNPDGAIDYNSTFDEAESKLKNAMF